MTELNTHTNNSSEDKRQEALNRLQYLTEVIQKHIHRDNVTAREVDLTLDCFRAVLWSRESEAKVVEAAEFYQKDVNEWMKNDVF